MTPRIPAYILAGGRSSRFGSDKARAERAGRPLLVSLGETLRSFAARVAVVADRNDRYGDLGFTTIADETPGQGPLGGLLVAIRDRLEKEGAGWLLLAPCDLVAFEPSWMAPLLELAADGTPAVACRSDRWHPLPALYHTSIEPLARRHLAGSNRALWRLLEAAGAAAVPLADGRDRWPQANAPEQL